MIQHDENRAAISLHPAIYQSLCARAQYMNTSVSALIEEAVDQWLHSDSEYTHTPYFNTATGKRD